MEPGAETIGGRYAVDGPARDRGLGTAWRARDLQRGGAAVLVKALDAAGAAEVQPVLRALRGLRHPSIPALLGYGVERGAAWAAWEEVAGTSLGTLLDAARAEESLIPLATLRAVCEGVTAALVAAHAEDPPVMHRRLSPGSVIVRAGEGGAVACAVVDLGVAPWLGDAADAAARSARHLIATPPELFRGEAADARTDVFLLAALWVEALARPAPTGETFAAVTPFRRRDDVPGAVWEALARAMSPSPAARHASVAAFASAMELAWIQPASVSRGTSPDSLLESIVASEGVPSLTASALPRWRVGGADGPSVVEAVAAAWELPDLPTTTREPAALNPWSTAVLDGVVDDPRTTSVTDDGPTQLDAGGGYVPHRAPPRASPEAAVVSLASSPTPSPVFEARDWAPAPTTLPRFQRAPTNPPAARVASPAVTPRRSRALRWALVGLVALGLLAAALAAALS